MERLSLDTLLPVAEDRLVGASPRWRCFVIDPALKDPDGREALNPEGLVPTVEARTRKQRFPELGVMTDVALDPYTSHGQDGLLDASGAILNDETVVVLVQQACCKQSGGHRGPVG